MTFIYAFNGKCRQYCLLLLNISCFMFYSNPSQCQETELANKNIYKIQLTDPGNKEKGWYYPERFSDAPAIKNNWRIVHNKGIKLFFEDSYGDIYDYRIIGDSVAVVVARKIINRVVPIENLKDSIELAIYYYFKKTPENNYKRSVSRFHYEEFDLNGFIGISDTKLPDPEIYYISIIGDKKITSIDNVIFTNRTLHPSVSPGLFITQDQSSDEYFCGLFRGGILTNPFENQFNDSLFLFQNNLVLAGHEDNLRFYRLSKNADPVNSENFTEVQPFSPDSRYTVVKKPGNIFAVFDQQLFTVKDISLNADDGKIEKAFINPFSNNLVLQLRKGEKIFYHVNDVSMSKQFKPILLPDPESYAEALSGNYLLVIDKTDKVSVLDMFTPRFLSLGIFPKITVREKMQWSSRPSAKFKYQRIGNDSIFLVIDHNMTGGRKRYTTAFCITADAQKLSNPIELKSADTIAANITETDRFNEDYLPHYFVSQQRFLIFQPYNSNYYQVRNIVKSFGKTKKPPLISGSFVSIRPYIRYEENWIAKAIEYYDGKERIKIILDP